MADRLDVVIFGASGFTGKATVIAAVKVLSKLSWGIAGRNKDKLDAILKEAGEKNETDLSKIPIIIADINDATSLDQMANRAKVIVNLCGPYRFYGEPVVKACINAGTHHVDVSGEVQFIERMQLEYNDLAKEKGVYIISACGFDSIPAEMGVIFFEKHFDGQVNSIESYLSNWVSGGYKGGATVHYGTWESAVYSLGFANEIRQIRSKLFANKLPPMEPKLKRRGLLHKSNDLWCMLFPGSDASVVARSQRFLYENEKKRPIQYNEYIGFRSLPAVLGLMLVGLIFVIFAKFSFGRKLLLNYPKLFSLGQFSHEGPSEDQRKRSKFALTLYGEGWPKEEQLAEATDKHTSPPTKKLVTRISGTDPGYTATGTALLLSATTILNEHTKMPGRGGVISPGAAFIKTNLIEELSKNGFTFEVIGAEEETKTDE